MCTIGAVIQGGMIYTFKQCDLIPVTEFDEPEIRQGTDGVEQYIVMGRAPGTSRIWAATNSEGVSFVAADSYTTSAYYVPDDAVAALFEAYEASVRGSTTVMDAANYLSNFYLTMGSANQAFPGPDISMFTGWMDAARTQPAIVFIEYMPGPNNHAPVRTIVRHAGHFASTNNFRIQPEAVNYPANHSTYLRLARAELILQQDPSLDGIERVLTDQYYGKTELSICRETEYIGQEYHTQATAIFGANPESTGLGEVLYQINGNPRSNPLRRFEGQS